ncbi:hypothetical protein ZEAMMB73_Zm00001d046999 [Zea mays]|nr:hypothetical protein ZEAMMB73_Zm00001d046999 [Zea mays]
MALRASPVSHRMAPTAEGRGSATAAVRAEEDGPWGVSGHGVHHHQQVSTVDPSPLAVFLTYSSRQVAAPSTPSRVPELLDLDYASAVSRMTTNEPRIVFILVIQCVIVQGSADRKQLAMEQLLAGAQGAVTAGHFGRCHSLDIEKKHVNLIDE